MRARPWIGFGILWFFAVLLPTHSVVPRLDLANDRHLYLAVVGLCLGIGVELELLRGRFPGASTAARVATMATFVLFGALTAVRNRDYRDEISLWEQTSRVSPQKSRVFNNLGFAYSAAGRLDDAAAMYRRALQLSPQYALARRNLASVQSRIDRR
jgi:tetratricopeptide (TPR) repeat protein